MAPWISYAFLVLGAWGIVAPTVTHYVTGWRTQVEERAACTIRINNAVTAVAKEINEAAERVVADAVEAANAVTPTPTAPAELQALCQSDKNCRGRK